MSYLVQKPKTAREAIRYFHAVALDYVADLKKQFPNHDISIEPSALPYDRQLSQLNIEVRVWDRILRIEFEIFTQPQKDDLLNTQLLGKGSISMRPHFTYALYVLPHDRNEWRYLKGHEQSGVLDADFLIEKMPRLLDQLPH